ncbi:MAG: hypothetical protein NT120_03445 [Candidatus Aenigmarchaeota archaeon]|nr:hypothetical protein [Candidatus Aenigmarchaeota archaeon]
MIEDLKISKVINSAKKEALKAGVKTDKWYYASIPCGTSRGKHEAKDVTYAKAKVIIRKIKPKVVGSDIDYKKIDKIIRNIDKTNNFSKVGGNLALGLSIATARAQTGNELWRLNGKKNIFPYPLVNVIGGGRHGGNTNFQEFLIVPYKEKTFHAAYHKAREIWLDIGKELKRRKLLLGSNLENAWISKLNDVETLRFLQSLELDVKLGMDFAASSLWNGKYYVYEKSGKKFTKDEHFEFVNFLVKEFDLFYAEDMFHEDDFNSFAELRKLHKKRLIVGDDLTATNPKRLAMVIKKKSISGIIVKPNQVGNLTLTQQVVDMAKKNRIKIIPSHRSSETKDSWQADLCVAWGAHLFKSGIVGFDAPKLERLAQLWKKIPGAKMGKTIKFGS